MLKTLGHNKRSAVKIIAAEEVLKTLKRDVAIRPFFHQYQNGGEPVPAAGTHLHLLDLARIEPAPHQIPQRQQIADKPAAPVGPGLGIE
ncbi:hypothetical protein, partial [Labrys miyagiensis]|uniref:hypothetical protein n=1 Tax=Labrys miyagiensis TaxID=346912 RepID=UPI0024E13FB7